MSNGEATLTTLFADVAGSTRLYEKLGDAQALRAIEECLKPLRAVTEELGGRVVKTIGDELMAVFPDADSAYVAATEMQWRVSELEPVDGDRLCVRIGFHYGPAVEQEGDVFGDSVNVAARLVALAKAEQVVTSAQTLELVSGELASSARHIGPVFVRGKSESLDLYEVIWCDSNDMTIAMSMDFAPRAAPRRLRLVHRGIEVTAGPECPTVSIGRDEGNAVVVDDGKASRQHARIEWRGDKFVLVDQSTNGTYIRNEAGVEVCLRREEGILDGTGTLSLGHAHRKGPRIVVEYYCA